MPPLLDRAYWRQYHTVRDAAKAGGACRLCAIEIAFATVPTYDEKPREPKLCPRCTKLYSERTRAA